MNKCSYHCVLLNITPWRRVNKWRYNSICSKTLGYLKWVVSLTLPPVYCHYWVIWDAVRNEVAKIKRTCLVLPRIPVVRPASLIIAMTELRFREFIWKLHLFLSHLVVSRSQAAGGCSAGDVAHVLLHQVELFVVWKKHTSTHTVVAVIHYSNSLRPFVCCHKTFEPLTACALSGVAGRRL